MLHTQDDVKTNAIRIEPVRSECYYQFTATTHSFLYKIQKLFYLIIRMNNSLTLSLGLTIQKNHTSKFIMVHHRRPQLRTHAPVQIAFPLIRSFFTMHTFWIKIFNGLDVVCVYARDRRKCAKGYTANNVLPGFGEFIPNIIGADSTLLYSNTCLPHVPLYVAATENYPPEYM